MSTEIKADFNEFHKRCLSQFNKAKRSYIKNLSNLNNLLKVLDKTILDDQHNTEINNSCARLGNNLSDIISYAKYEYKEEKNLIYLSVISSYIEEFLNNYNILYRKKHLISKVSLNSLSFLLNKLNRTTRYFVFDYEKNMKIFKKYIGDSLKSTINNSLKKNPYIIAAFIGGLFSIIVTLLRTFLV